MTGTKVGVTVSTTPGARITVVAHFEAGDWKKTAHADATGVHRFWFPVGTAPAGIRVLVVVRVFLHGQKRFSRVWFTPRQPPPPPVAAPAPTPSPKHNNSGAWCTARAVYNAQYNDYDVYVHSNQPNQTAVATASNGEQQPYQTNANGYADIYLYADPGNTITVTVGAASCSTTA
jgi:hypothetical protein